LFGLAVIGIAIAVGVRIARHEPHPSPRFLADTVILDSPPPLPRGDVPASLERIRALVALPSRQCPAFGRAALEAGDLLEAREAFQRAANSTPRPDVDTLAGLADAARRLGLCREALAAYTRLAELAPRDYRAYVGESETLDLLGRRAEAARALDAALQRLAPDDVAAHIAVAGQFEAFGDLARALSVAEELRARRPESEDAVLETAHLLIKSERPEDALPLLREVLARDPGNARARYQLGVVLDNPVLPGHNALLAEDALLTAIETSPSETPAYRRLIEMYEQQGRFRQSAYVSLRLLGLTPNSAEVRLHLATAYAHLGDSPGASEQGRIASRLIARDRDEAALNTRIHQRPADSTLRLALARHYLAAGRLAEALPPLQAAVVLAPGSPEARRELAALCARLGLPAASPSP
jgi:tetratricopeptide (TPR) repeat protein